MQSPETTTVYSTASPPDDPYVFADCRWKVDDTGCLHIFRVVNRETIMIAAFGAGSWHLVHADAQVHQ